MLPISLGPRKRQDSWREGHHFQQVKHPIGRFCKCGKSWQADSGRCSGEGAAAAPHSETGSRRRACHHFIGILDQDVEQTTIMALACGLMNAKLFLARDKVLRLG